MSNQGEQVTLTSEVWDLWIIEGEVRRRAIEVFEGAFAWWRNFISSLPSHEAPFQNRAQVNEQRL
jgi:hypothetical protein